LFIKKTHASAISALYINSRRGVPVPHASTNTLEVGGLRLEADASQIEDLGLRLEAIAKVDESETLMKGEWGRIFILDKEKEGSHIQYSNVWLCFGYVIYTLISSKGLR
jgi:hypothetical protein